jgi:hypothetical protein
MAEIFSDGTAAGACEPAARGCTMTEPSLASSLLERAMRPGVIR